MSMNSKQIMGKGIGSLFKLTWQALAIASLTVSLCFTQSTALTEDQIIQMWKVGLPEDVIVARIKSEPTLPQLSTDDLIKLKKAGVSDGVIRALATSEPIAPSAAAAATAPTPMVATPAPTAPKPAEPDEAEKVYLLDSSDRSLKLLPEAPAKVVTHHRGITGAAGAIQIPGTTSSFRAKGGVDLEFIVKCTNPARFEFYAFQTREDNREALVSKAKAGLIHGVSSQPMGKIPVEITRYGDSSYRFVVKAPEPGEYGFAVGWSVFNFGLDSK